MKTMNRDEIKAATAKLRVDFNTGSGTSWTERIAAIIDALADQLPAAPPVTENGERVFRRPTDDGHRWFLRDGAIKIQFPTGLVTRSSESVGNLLNPAKFIEITAATAPDAATGALERIARMEPDQHSRTSNLMHQIANDALKPVMPPAPEPAKQTYGERVESDVSESSGRVDLSKGHLARLIDDAVLHGATTRQEAIAAKLEANPNGYSGEFAVHVRKMQFPAS